MWQPYIPVAKRREQAKRKIEKLKKKGKKIEPVEISGRIIAKKFWGKQWCKHLETFADFSNRLPRGRTYARNGSICHLEIKQGSIKALVNGNDLYNVELKITPLMPSHWKKIKAKCSGQIHSLLELLQGKLSDHVMEIVATHTQGLFPNENEMQFKCDCFDWAGMCKHIAAVLYGIGNRLDDQPNLLFLLRSVDPTELVATHLTTSTTETDNLLDDNELGGIFGIELDGVSNDNQNQKNAQAKQITGSQLQEARTKMQLSVRELANRLGVVPNSIYRWERTKGPLKLRQFSQKALDQLLANEYTGMVSKR